jgi:hypothetical protein
MKMGKDGMMWFWQVVWYDMTLSQKNTQNASTYIKSKLFPWNPLNRKIQTKMGIALPYMGMKMGKDGMMWFWQVVWYDMTLSPKNTQNASTHIKSTLFPGNPLNRKNQTKMGIALPYMGMKMGKNGMIWFWQVEWNDMTLSEKHTKCKHVHQINTVPMESLEQENPNKVGNYTTIHGDENGKEWHDVVFTGGMIWYDTLTKTHTKCKHVHQINTVSMNSSE